MPTNASAVPRQSSAGRFQAPGHAWHVQKGFECVRLCELRGAHPRSTHRRVVARTSADRGGDACGSPSLGHYRCSRPGGLKTIARANETGPEGPVVKPCLRERIRLQPDTLNYTRQTATVEANVPKPISAFEGSMLQQQLSKRLHFQAKQRAVESGHSRPHRRHLPWDHAPEALFWGLRKYRAIDVVQTPCLRMVAVGTYECPFGVCQIPVSLIVQYQSCRNQFLALCARHTEHRHSSPRAFPRMQRYAANLTF